MPESHFVYTFNTTGSNVNMSCTADNRVTGITRVLEDPPAGARGRTFGGRFRSEVRKTQTSLYLAYILWGFGRPVPASVAEFGN